MRTLTSTFILLLVALIAKGQQDGQFSFYTVNQLFYNPAFAGADHEWNNLTVTHRTTWLGYESSFDDGASPSTQLVSGTLPLRFGNNKNGFGFGIHFLNETFANTSIQEFQISTAWSRKISPQANLSVGIRTGLYGKGLDYSRFRPVDDDDPLIPDAGVVRQFVPDFALGVYLAHEDFFVGVAANHLTEPGFEDFGNNALPLRRHFNLMAGYFFELSPKLELSPSAILKYDSNISSFEVSLLGSFDERYFLGVSYREQDAIILQAGYGLTPDKRLRLFYALDFVTSSTVAAKSATSHEIILNYRIPKINIRLPSPERSPRFRFE